MKFRLTRPALRDLAEIGRYTRELWGKEQARDYGSAMTVRLKWLSRNEPLWHERPELDAGIFSYPHQSHVIFFRRCHIGIEILRILHRRMDPARHMEHGEPE
jgi:toxin ParE1/3/4